MTETPERPLSPVLNLESFADAYQTFLPRLRSQACGLLESDEPPRPSGASVAAEAERVDEVVLKAAFQVWRGLAATSSEASPGDELLDELTAAVRELAPRARAAGLRAGPSLELVARQLERLPRRQLLALWLTDVLGLPTTEVGNQLRTNRYVTAVLLYRAREGVRQACLREQQGTPARASCVEHWERMPAHIRGTDSSWAADELSGHVAHCADCHARLRQLVWVSEELATMLGPALLSLFVRGGVPQTALPVVRGGALAPSDAGQLDGPDASHAPDSVAPFRFVRRLADQAFNQTHSTGGGLVTVAVLCAAVAAR